LIAITCWSILASPNKMDDYAGVRILVFRVADLACAADAAAVREILPAQAATRIPGSPDAVDGLINVRGQLVTLVNGRHALSHPPGDGSGPIILVEVGDWTVGLAVDAVLDMFSVTPDELSERGDLPGIDARLVRAVGRRANLSFVLLDIDALLRPFLDA
jgi:purine-binding chemotaxis protein CheW